MIRVFEAFAGYGSQLMALRRLEKKWGAKMFQPVGYSEIDKYAISAYQAVHGTEHPNYGDISKIDWEQVPNFDLFTYSWPCQSVSNAGLQKGFKEGSGTTSSLLWECKRAIQAKHPRWLLMENVKALVSKKFMPDFQKWLAFLDSEGYVTSWKVMNAKDYGVPQNRERVFAVSELKYQFPQPIKLEKCLQDVLEEEVDESYYLKDDVLDKFQFDEKFKDEYERIKAEVEERGD